MFTKNWKLSFSVCALAMVAACCEGEYNDLKCDSTKYVPQCLDARNLMQCDNNALVVVKCAELNYCKMSDKGGECIPDPNNNNNVIIHDWCEEGSLDCDGDYIVTCHSNNWDKAETPCQHGCNKGACKTDNEYAECDDATPCKDGFSCNKGGCVPTAMLNAKVGDKCEKAWYDPHYYEICTDGGKLRYCDLNSSWEYAITEWQCDSGCDMAYIKGGVVSYMPDAF